MEQEEEFSTLLKKIDLLKKETPALKQEEEFLTNDVFRKLTEVGTGEGTDQTSL